MPKRIGAIAFFGLLAIVLLLSIGVDLNAYGMIITGVAVLFAILVALINITEDETLKTLVAGLVLVVFGGSALYGATIESLTFVGPLLMNMGLFFGIVGVITALKVMFIKGMNK